MAGISCVMRPFGEARKTLEVLGSKDPQRLTFLAALDELQAVDVLADLLDEALVATTSGAGTLDLKAIAAYVLRRIKEHQK